MSGHTHRKWYHHIVENFSVDLHAKNQLDLSIISRDIALWWLLQSDWSKAFGPMTWAPEFYQIWAFWWNTKNRTIFHSTFFPGKTNTKMLQRMQKNIAFSPFLGKSEFFWKICHQFFQLWEGIIVQILEEKTYECNSDESWQVLIYRTLAASTEAQKRKSAKPGNSYELKT